MTPEELAALEEEIERLRLLERMLDHQIRRLQSERAHIRRKIRQTQRRRK